MREAQKEARIGEEPKATITILIYFDRVFIDSNRLRAALGPEGLGGFGFPPKPLWTPLPP